MCPFVGILLCIDYKLQADAASELLFLQAASTAQAEQLNCMRIFNVDSNEVQHRNFNFQLQL
jgi:hypothetical protein